MTILVAYVPRPEGQIALDKGLEIAKRRQERLVVVNASPGGSQEDASKADVQDVERVEAEYREDDADQNRYQQQPAKHSQRRTAEKPGDGVGFHAWLHGLKLVWHGGT